MLRIPFLNRRILLVLIALAPVFLSSCLDTSMDIRLHRSGKATAEIEYLVDGSIADFGRGFGADEPWPFPLTEKDFRQRLLMSDGIELKRYKERQTEDGDTVYVKLSSGSLEDLFEFLGMEASHSDGSLELIFPISNQYDAAVSETRAVFETVLEEMAFSISFRPPSKPSSTSLGDLDGRKAVYSTTLKDMLMADSAAVWTIAW